MTATAGKGKLVSGTKAARHSDLDCSSEMRGDWSSIRTLWVAEYLVCTKMTLKKHIGVYPI